jgi:branched-chain amino acid transport system ATP-binding protein
VARTFQLMRVFPSMTVLENVVVASYLRNRRRSAAERRATEVLSVVELAGQADSLAGSLTVAWKKRKHSSLSLSFNLNSIHIASYADYSLIYTIDA